MKKIKTKRLCRRIVRNSVIIMTLLLTMKTALIKAQDNGISFSFKDAALETVLNEIKNQSDINIVFNHEEVNKSPKISVEVRNVSVEEALRESLRNTPLEFRKINNTIIIKPKKEQSAKTESEKKLKTQTLRGRVVDRDSKTGLPFANIVVLNTTPALGVISDDDGNFKIEDLPVGRHTLQVSYVGYERAILPEILVGSAKEVVLTVELAESFQSVNELVVSVKKGQPLNEMATISGKSFSVEETKRYAASISDPARMAQVFAGVSTTDDASNEIVIRGNSPNWMLWRLEGVEIPSPNHFAEEGYTAGAVSILSTNMLGKSDFYTGAFPAEYGDALSGVFDLKLRNGNNEKHEYSAQIGVLGAEAAAEGPFKKGYKGSYLINYRYATFSLLNDLNIHVSENTLPNYQDLSFKFFLPTKKMGSFSIWGIGGDSDADEKFLPDTTLDQDLDNGYYDRTKTGMMASGISHTIFPDSRSYIKSVISYSGSRSSNNVGDMDTMGIMHNTYNDRFRSGAIRFNSYYNRKVSRKFTVRAGIEFSQLNFNYFSEYADDNGVLQDGINGNGKTNMFQAYVQSKYKLTQKISFTGGVHYSHFALSNDNSIEPRASMQMDIGHKQKLGLGFGMHSKNENLPAYYVAFQNQDGTISYLNKSLGLTRSTHFVLSYEKFVGEDWLVKVETYYQQISNLPVPNNPDKPLAPAFNGVFHDDTLVNDGKGKNYGLELTVQKFFTHNYYLLFSNSLFQSKYRPFNGNWYNTRFNSNYIFNLVGGKEITWSENKMISLNGKLLWSGGKRLVPIDLASSVTEGETVYNYDEVYKTKGPDYFRIDVGVKLHFFRKKSEHILALDIQNVTNRLNVWTQFYDPKKGQIADYYMAGLIPILSYRIEF